MMKQTRAALKGMSYVAILLTLFQVHHVQGTIDVGAIVKHKHGHLLRTAKIASILGSVRVLWYDSSSLTYKLDLSTPDGLIPAVPRMFKALSEWTCEEVAQWAKKAFNIQGAKQPSKKKLQLLNTLGWTGKDLVAQTRGNLKKVGFKDKDSMLSLIKNLKEKLDSTKEYSFEIDQDVVAGLNAISRNSEFKKIESEMRWGTADNGKPWLNDVHFTYNKVSGTVNTIVDERFKKRRLLSRRFRRRLLKSRMRRRLLSRVKRRERRYR